MNKRMKKKGFPKKEVGKKDEAKQPIMKETIDGILKGIPWKKVRRAEELFEDWWCEESLDKEQQLEQIYRAFYSSFKTRRSYWCFKVASVLLLYLYGYISEKEISAIKEKETEIDKLFEKNRTEIDEVKEVDDVLRNAKFMGNIPMNVSLLAIGAGIAFTRAVKSILDVMERLHKDKEYREGLYTGRAIKWDEAILLKALPFEWMRKGGKVRRKLHGA